MSVRAKMTLSNIVTTEFGGGQKYSKVRFDAVYDPSIPEDQRFQKATPSGHIEMQIDNPAALEQLKIGTPYYVDFTPVPKPDAQ